MGGGRSRRPQIIYQQGTQQHIISGNGFGGCGGGAAPMGMPAFGGFGGSPALGFGGMPGYGLW